MREFDSDYFEDLVTGGELIKILNERRAISEDVAKLILAELIVSAERMHKANVLHLDLHSGNILIDNEGHLVVIDYGLSQWRSNSNADDIKSEWLYLYYTLSEVDDKLPEDMKKLLMNMTECQVPGKTCNRFLTHLKKNT